MVEVIKNCKLSTNLLYYYPSEGKIMIWTKIMIGFPLPCFFTIRT